MNYTFAAERKLIFVVQTGGRKRLVEFGDRNENGASVFVTTDEAVAIAVRKSSMSRRGVIVETTKKPEPVQAAKTVKNDQVKPAVQESPAMAVREYANFTLAREAIIKEFSLKKSEVRNPTALARVAQERGFSIKYTNAEK